MMTTRPHVVVIMSDQHHPRFMGCAGHALIRTPHLDALAARGTRFSRAYCNSPLSCPSRMSFMTSQLPSTLGCIDNAFQLGSDVPTFAHAFNAAGYETVLCGRMHFNGADQRHGFQKRILSDVLPTYGNPAAHLREVLGETLVHTTGPSANAIRTSGPGPSGYQAYDRAVTDKAVGFLRDRSDDASPLMMVVGYVLPHAPFVAPKEDYDFYDAKITTDDLPVSDPDTLHPEMQRLQRRAKLLDAEPVSLEDQRRARVAYHGMCTLLDRLVGEVIDAIERAGMTDNTVIVYTSDHGEQLGEHGMWWKHTFYEGSAGIPMIFAGPGIPASNQVSHNVSLLDLGPTLLELAGAPALPTAEGRSFRGLLEGHAEDWHDAVICENLWPPDATCLHRMVKQGPWKLCHYHGFAPQLFNLDHDPDENHDRADDPTCRDALNALMHLATADWNHDAIMRRHHAQRAIQPWIRHWLEHNDLPEPEPWWFESAK